MLRLLFRGFLLFFFNAPATTEIYTLSLHDALPISRGSGLRARACGARAPRCVAPAAARDLERALPRRRADRKSTRLNSSHVRISYAVFCLKKKKNRTEIDHPHRPDRGIRQHVDHLL